MNMKTLRTFYIVAATQTLSILGSAMSSFAIAVWIFTETGNTTPLMLVAVMTWLPRMFLGSFAGVFADRLNRKMLIIFSDAMQALPTLLLLLSFATNNFALWQLYLAALFQGFFSMVQGPALFASITMLVPDEHRDRANALVEIMGPAANIAAPVIGGLLYAIVNIEGILAIDVATFLIAVGIIFFVDIPQPRKSKESSETQGSVWSEMQGAIGFLKSRPSLLLFSLYFMLVNFLTTGIWRLMTPYILTRLDYNEEQLGLVLAVSSAGLVFGGLIPMLWKGTTRRIDTVMPAMAIATLCLMIFALAKSLPGLIIIVFVMMIPYKWTNALTSSIRQGKIPLDMQGRIFALLSQISTFAIPATMLITGPLVDYVLVPLTENPNWQIVEPYFGTGESGGIALYIFVCGFLLFLVTLGFYALPLLRNIEAILPDYVPEEAVLAEAV